MGVVFFISGGKKLGLGNFVKVNWLASGCFFFGGLRMK